MGRTLAVAVALGTLVAGCEPVGGMGRAGPAANPVELSGAMASQEGVGFGGSAEFGVTR